MVCCRSANPTTTRGHRINGSLAAAAGVIAVFLAATAAAAATSADIVRTYAGITCTWPGSKTLSEGGALCWRADGAGVVGSVTQSFVMVRTRSGRTLFFRNQPLSNAFGQIDDSRVFHSESHRGIICKWSHIGGGGTLCARADNRGLVVGVARLLVAVTDERNRKILYLKNQP